MSILQRGANLGFTFAVDLGEEAIFVLLSGKSGSAIGVLLT